MTGQDKTGSAEELEAIRRDIDAIDDGLLTLLERRFAASERVKLAKSKTARPTGSPFRPAREAAIMRRLLARAQGRIPSDVLVRLWRLILTASSQSQANVTIHLSKKLASSTAARLAIRDHFGNLPIEEYRDEAQALLQLDPGSADICIVEPASPWVEPLLAATGSRPKVTGVLPALIDKAEVPRLLVIGHSPAEATGDDHTILITSGRLPRDFAPHPAWEVKSGDHRLSCVPGFLSEHESPLVGLTRSNPQLNLIIAGHYPAPFGAQS